MAEQGTNSKGITIRRIVLRPRYSLLLLSLNCVIAWNLVRVPETGDDLAGDLDSCVTETVPETPVPENPYSF